MALTPSPQQPERGASPPFSPGTLRPSASCLAPHFADQRAKTPKVQMRQVEGAGVEVRSHPKAPDPPGEPSMKELGGEWSEMHERQRERETERERERYTERYRDRETQRDTERHREMGKEQGLGGGSREESWGPGGGWRSGAVLVCPLLKLTRENPQEFTAVTTGCWRYYFIILQMPSQNLTPSPGNLR